MIPLAIGPHYSTHGRIGRVSHPAVIRGMTVFIPFPTTGIVPGNVEKEGAALLALSL